ncbi:MAG: glucose-6-phosphate isomerase [Lactobacillus sp.]|jgi:glucose-6-phosphate isomerase|nr:glucose-6-phosphate isomerase [Lactobacillus sp.]
MTLIHFKTNYLKKFVHSQELEQMRALTQAANEELRQGTGAGHDFRGWLDLPVDYDQAEFKRIQTAAAKIQADSDVLICIGIGGSYLGAQAAIEFLQSSFPLPSKLPKVVFCGNSLSGSYLHDLIEWLGERDFSLNVISKSGTTTETSIAFRILKRLLVKKYGEQAAAKRIYATTDRAKGALKTEAKAAGYETFVIPDDLGGRFSVLSAVGLLPIAVAGGDIKALMHGAAEARQDYAELSLSDSPYEYAVMRNILYRKGYTTELLDNFEPKLRMLGEWWKQLMGESEGKDEKGIFPASANLTTDLHSLGQYIQQGRRNLMETMLWVKQPSEDQLIPEDAENLDQLNFLAGKTMNYVNRQAFQGVVLAHTDGGVPVMTLELPDTTAKTLGYLIYFFELAVGISGYLNGINPFNQPGVEAYKRNMFGLLGKPGYENLHEDLQRRLQH